MIRKKPTGDLLKRFRGNRPKQEEVKKMTIREKSTKESDMVEKLCGSHHHKHEISDTSRNIHVERLGRTAEEAQRRAGESYHDARSKKRS